MSPVSCAVLAELSESYFSAHFVAWIARKLQFGLCCYPEAERVSPAGQPAHGLTGHPEGAAAQEEDSRAYFSHQLPRRGLHGRLPPCCPCRARDTEDKFGGYARSASVYLCNKREVRFLWEIRCGLTLSLGVGEIKSLHL